MNDKLKAMYAEGGLLKALLKDPKQREMAKGMIKEYEEGGKMEYRMGGMAKNKSLLGAPAGLVPGAKNTYWFLTLNQYL